MLEKSHLLRTLKNHRPWNQTPHALISSLTHVSKPRLTPNDVVSTNISITRLCKNGQLDIARKVFDEMPNRTVVSWNAMICGYSKWERYNEALSLFSAMHRSYIHRFTETTFSKTLSACARSRSFSTGKEVHCLVLKSGAESLSLVSCALLSFYASSARMDDAERVFDELRGGNDLLWSVMLVGYVQHGMLSEAMDLFVEMPKRDVLSWTGLISGYAKSEDRCWRALELFKWMRSEFVVPNEFTLDSVIRVFGRLELLIEGKAAHGFVVKFGLESEYAISGALIEFYCGCESIDCAKKVYYGIDSRCTNCSSSLISGLASLGRMEEAGMIFNGLSEKDSVCCNLMIKGYFLSGQMEKSKRVFERMKHKTIVSSNTMISVYSRNKEIEKAISLFEVTKGERDHITWNSMISGFVQNHMHDEAFELYSTMRQSLVDYTRSTFCVLLNSCSCLGSLQLGQSLHAQLAKTLLESDVYLGTSLVDMYSKCGSIVDARKSFRSIISPNVAAWTALINSFAVHGLGSVALCHFNQMLVVGIAPNPTTFIAVLCACRFVGLTNQGMQIFHSMRRDYRLTPSLEHYACVVDLLGRSGRLQEAFDFINDMDVEPDSVIWCTLLNACWFWMDTKLGEMVVEKMIGLEPKPVFGHVILSNMYAMLGKWRERAKLRKRMKSLEAKKVPGCSWIEVNSKVNVFYVEDKSHTHCDEIYSVLENLAASINSVVRFENACKTSKVSDLYSCYGDLSVSTSKLAVVFCINDLNHDSGNLSRSMNLQAHERPRSFLSVTSSSE